MWNNLSLKGNKFVFKPNDQSNHLYEIIYNIIQNIDKNNISILDMGCGSGAIGLALSKNINKNIQLTGIDIVEDAIKYSNQNAINNDIQNYNFIKSNLFDNIEENNFDIIFSSVPYLNYETCALKYSFQNIKDEQDSHFTPLPAVCVGNDSDENVLIKEICKKSFNFLPSNGYLIIQINKKEEQLQTILTLLQDNFTNIQVVKKEKENFLIAQRI